MHHKRAVRWMTVLIALLAVVSNGIPVAASAKLSNGRITFGKYDPSLGDFSLWAANPDGTNQQRLTKVPSFDSSWKPNGKRIAFDFGDATGEHIATMGPNGGDVRQLTASNAVEEEPDWSSDGRWITFDASATSPNAAHFHTSIWLMRSNGSHARQLTHGGFDVEPVFSPDGSRIAFGRITRPADDPTRQREAIDVIDVDGTHLRQVVGPSDLEHPDWSPSGRWISFNIVPEDARGAVVVVHPNGTGHHVIKHSNDRMRFFNAVWSPDGQHLLVGCHDVSADVDDLCAMDATGRDVQVVIDSARVGVNFPAWGIHPLDP